MHSDYASLQMLFPERGSGGELRLLSFRGFNPEAAKFWEWVRADGAEWFEALTMLSHLLLIPPSFFRSDGKSTERQIVIYSPADIMPSELAREGNSQTSDACFGIGARH